MRDGYGKLRPNCGDGGGKRKQEQSLIQNIEVKEYHLDYKISQQCA